MGKYALLVIAGFILVFGWTQASLNRINQDLTHLFVTHYEQTEAKITANTLASMSLTTLKATPVWRIGYAHLPIGNSTGGSVIDDWHTDPTILVNRVRISAWGNSNGFVDSTLVTAIVPALPLGVHGAITANSIVKELGNLVIDGRDHDLNGTLLPQQGTKGVSTTQTLHQSGSAEVGGTNNGIDYLPARPAHPAVVEEFATYDYPTTPDEVFGYTEGALKAQALSGVNGGQYVTSPDNLTWPLSGVTYVELGNGAIWQSIDFTNSEGVLVVHNEWGNAKMKNLNGGIFKGLIIVDDLEKIHATIYGGIITLTATPSGNCIGNGSGEVRYSSETLLQSASVSAGGSGGIQIVSWLE